LTSQKIGSDKLIKTRSIMG